VNAGDARAAVADRAGTISVVVIGRNEGARLARCLESVGRARWPALRPEVIYVDSASTDGSVGIAAGMGARCLVLEDGSPCAAKARNLGWRAAQGEFILFLDGDTQLEPGFVAEALEAMRRPELCAVWGHRRESDPGQSLYTRVLDLDWVYPVGPSLYFGGDVLVRRAALEAAGGFDPALKAGEEPELCARLRKAGWAIEHIDAPMTTHDLAIRSLRAYWRRCYRSGIAYAEVAARARAMGDALWQREARRDLGMGALYVVFPVLLLAALAWDPHAAAALLAIAALVVVRTTWRCRWKAPGHPGLAFAYAIHSHAQKVPAFFGQLAWHLARRGRGEIGLVEYKDNPPATPARRITGKRVLARGLAPLAWLVRVGWSRWMRLWSFARLRESIGGQLDATGVVLGTVEVHGTRNIRIGRDVLIYPGVYLETQGAGRIEIGDRVVLSRGVHIVAFDRVVVEDDCMVGEYASIRDANHRAHEQSMRDSGHDAQPIHLGRNVWIGRGVTVLKGTRIGACSIVGANAVVTRSLHNNSRAAGIPARPLRVEPTGVHS